MRKWLGDYEDMYRDACVNLRLPKALVLEFKRKAAARRMPYQRLMRAVLQEAAKTLQPRPRSSQKNGRATISAFMQLPEVVVVKRLLPDSEPRLARFNDKCG
jgi:hypothetical protein